MKKPISQANEQELRDFARNHLGLPLPPNAKRDTLVAKIRAAWDKDHILIGVSPPDDTVAPEGGAPPPVLDDQKPAKGDDMVKIKIAITDSPGGDEDVPVSVNGRAMLIPRDRVVEVPAKYVEALEHAVEHRYEPMPDGNGINPVPRKVPKYPFQKVA